MVDVSVHAYEIEIRDADTRHLLDRPRPDAWLLSAVQDRRIIPAGAIRAQHPAAIVHIAMALFTRAALF
jgi:hypothetical protein